MVEEGERIDKGRVWGSLIHDTVSAETSRCIQGQCLPGTMCWLAASLAVGAGKLSAWLKAAHAVCPTADCLPSASENPTLDPACLWLPVAYRVCSRHDTPC